MSTAFVTGGGRGIGRAIALGLARDGHGVAVNDVDKGTGEKIISAVSIAGHSGFDRPGHCRV